MASYGPLCTEFYDHDKPRAPVDAVKYYTRRAQEARGPVLEPMCGSGRFLLPILRSNVEVEGVDDSPAMLEACMRHAALQRLKPVLYEQPIDELALPKRYRMAFIPAGSIGLLDPTSLDRALCSVRRHLEPNSPLLLELVYPIDVEPCGEVAAPRVVSIDDETRITYACRVGLSADQKAIQYTGRYEKLRRTQLLATEDELLMLWRHQPQDFLDRLHQCGYVGAHLITGTAYPSLGSNGCIGIEAYTEA